MVSEGEISHMLEVTGRAKAHTHLAPVGHSIWVSVIPPQTWVYDGGK